MKEGRKEGGWMDREGEGGRKEGRKERKEGRKEGRKEERTEMNDRFLGSENSSYVK